MVAGFSSGHAKATKEIEDYISRADKTTRAFQAVRCQNPDCSQPIPLPSGQLKLGQDAPYGVTQRVTMNCPSCHSLVSWPAGDLLVLVEPLN
jgi:hypothetical protein